MPKKINWREIKETYLAEDVTYTELASRFDVSLSSIEHRASKEGWKYLEKTAKQPQKLTVFAGGKSNKVDELELLDTAIHSLSTGVNSAEFKSAEGCATALVKLLEARQKFSPKSASDIADMCLNLNISPQDFIRELSNKWQARA